MTRTLAPPYSEKPDWVLFFDEAHWLHHTRNAVPPAGALRGVALRTWRLMRAWTAWRAACARWERDYRPAPSRR